MCGGGKKDECEVPTSVLGCSVIEFCHSLFHLLELLVDNVLRVLDGFDLLVDWDTEVLECLHEEVIDFGIS